MEMIQPLVEVLKAVWSPIARYTGYVVNPQKNFKELSKRVQDLCARKEDSQNHIKLAKRQQAPTNEYLGWLASVERIAEEVKNIEETQPYEKRCFRGWFPDVIARVKHGDYVAEKIVQVKELQEKSKFESGFLVDLPPHQVEERPAFALKEETSAHRTLRKILAYIREEGIKKIGIWGMGGIGKTTLMTMLNNMEEIKEMFEIVIWVTVSKSWSTSSLQDIIANRLSLDVRNISSGTRKSDDEVLSMLFRELKSKKFLLLLDDVWNWVDLSKLGIPITNQDRGYTIVLTTRELSVCREMETDVDIKVETLAEGEAWEIFHSRVGDIDTSSTIYAIAKDIVRECQGLPLALNVVGGALRRVRDVRVWRNILKMLRSPEISHDDHPSGRVFDSLQVSYEALNNPNLKNSFLYCGLYPEDHQITKSELIEYWRAEGLLPSSSRRTLEEARDEGHQQLHGLIDASLLEECKDDDKHIKMHDVVRDLVLKMTSSGGESRHIVRAGLLSEEETLVEDKEWEEATRISFMFNRCIFHLPEMPNCPKLSSLLFQSKMASTLVTCVSRLEVIPKAFFNQMPNLRVLDLSYTLISSLPCSISNLVSLRALFLRGCYRLGALPHEVNLLKGLEVLSLKESCMEAVPTEIWELSSLKCLKFSSVSDDSCINTFSYFHYDPSPGSPELIRVIFPSSSKKISQLGELEEVSVLWGEVDQESHQSVEIIAKELGRLARLSSLEFNFVTVNNLSHFLQESSQWRNDKLMEFFFIVEEQSSKIAAIHEHLKDRWKRCLVFKCTGGDEESCGSSSSDRNIIAPSAIREVLLRSHFLLLHGDAEVKQLVSYLGAENICGLRYCEIYEFGALENISRIEDGRQLEKDAFTNLEVLRLFSLENLRSICHCQPSLLRSRLVKQLSTNSFASLWELQIGNCPKLKSLFSWDGEIEDDRVALGDGIAHEGGFEYELPKLKFLELENLPELVGCSNLGNVSLCCPLLEKVRVVDCPKLKTLPFDVNGAPNLKSIVGQQQWWDALQWAAKSRFIPLFSPNWKISFL